MSDELDRVLDMFQQQHPEYSKEKILEELYKGSKFYADQIRKHWDTVQKRISSVHAIHKLIDEEVARQPADRLAMVKCHKGCAHCCHIQVIITKAEAELLYQLCIEDGLPIDRAYLERQEHLGKHDYNKGIDNRCHFLNEQNECSVYEYRPAACRKYLVATDPELCNTVTHPYGEVASLFLASTEVMTQGLFMVDRDEGGTLPQQLLKVIRERE